MREQSWVPVRGTNGRGRGFGSAFQHLRMASEVIAPADVMETDEALVISMDLPGHDPGAVDVELDGRVLTVQSERKRPEMAEGIVVHRAERAMMKVSRSFALPSTVDGGRIEAAYDAGVLTITMPKRAEAKPRAIQVKLSNGGE